MDCENVMTLLQMGATCEQTDHGFRIATDCLYPSFDRVCVYIVPKGDGFIVTDGGDAGAVARRHGRDESAALTGLKKASLRFGLGIEDGVLIAEWVEPEWLQSAVLAVANASAMAAAAAVDIVTAKNELRLRDMIYAELLKTVPEKHIASGYHYRGLSGKEWTIDFAVTGDTEIPILIKGVSDHPKSISSSYIVFSDIGGSDPGQSDKFARCAVYDRDLTTESSALMRQVAQLVPLSSVRPGIQRLVRH